VHAVLGSPVWMIAEREQRRDVAARHQPHVSAGAPVATVGPTERDRALSPERDAAGSAVSATHIQLGFVDKSTHWCSLLTVLMIRSLRSLIGQVEAIFEHPSRSLDV